MQCSSATIVAAVQGSKHFGHAYLRRAAKSEGVITINHSLMSFPAVKRSGGSCMRWAFPCPVCFCHYKQQTNFHEGRDWKRKLPRIAEVDVRSEVTCSVIDWSWHCREPIIISSCICDCDWLRVACHQLSVSCLVCLSVGRTRLVECWNQRSKILEISSLFTCALTHSLNLDNKPLNRVFAQ